MGRRLAAAVGTLVGREPAEESRAQGDGHVADRGGGHRASDAPGGHQKPGAGERAGGGAQHVDAVQVADRAPRRAGDSNTRPHEKRQRHPHERRGWQQHEEVKQAADPRRARKPRGSRVEPVVVEEGTRGAEHADGQFERSKRPQRRAPRPPGAQLATELAPDAEPRHERGDNHGNRVQADTAVQGENALPRHLVHEGGGAAEKEEKPGQKGVPPSS